ncbi:MAG: hypothetical protein IJM15_01595 [Erysipelotrichaceae bacterium]|nr:hypothetical protein [Erysipelotrichaceae bacterium]
MSENENRSDLGKTKKYGEPLFKTEIENGNEEAEENEELLEEDDEYEYVTPHYTRNSILLVLFCMIAGAVIMYFLAADSIVASIREDYLKQGYMLTNDANATPSDIAQGKTAYVNGRLITGTYVELDTSVATATEADILKGYTAYVNSVKITGGIASFRSTTNYMPGKNQVTISKKGVYIAEDIIIQGDQNLLPQNIKAGVTIFGVKGTYSGN